MVTCRNFISGRCNKGSSCPDAHPGEKPGAPINRSRVPFNANTAPLDGKKNNKKGKKGGPPHPFPTNKSKATGPPPTNKSKAAGPPPPKPEDAIRHNILSVQREWPLSCYGMNLLWEGGDNIIHGDHSPEELRCEAYAQMKMKGNIVSYIQAVKDAKSLQTKNEKEIIENIERAIALAQTPRSFRLQQENLKHQVSPSNSSIQSLESYALGSTTNQPIEEVQFSFGSIPEVMLLPPKS